MFQKSIFPFILVLTLAFIRLPPVYSQEITEAVLSPAVVLPIRKALVTGIEQNLNLTATRLNVPISGGDVIVAEAVYDPIADALFFGRDQKILSPSASCPGTVRTRSAGPPASGRSSPSGYSPICPFKAPASPTTTTPRRTSTPSTRIS